MDVGRKQEINEVLVKDNLDELQCDKSRKHHKLHANEVLVIRQQA
ncbi:hypothetical protein [Aquibacillus sediminis]|nr:hypothetical protein [Aquibacillus sediminis]